MSFADHDAERSVIATVLGLRHDAQGPTYARLAAIVTPRDFDHPGHALVWQAMAEVLAAGRPVDAVTLSAALTQRKRFHTVGGASFFRDIAEGFVDGAHADAHAELVLDRALRRRALAAADAHRARILGGEEVAQSVARMERESREGIAGPRDLSLHAAVTEAWNELDDARTTLGRYGVGALDGSDAAEALLGGLFGGQLTTLGAVPGGGKTALALTATNATAQAGGRVLFGALEMPRTDIVWRLAAGYCTGHPPSVDRIRAQQLNAYELTDLEHASRHLSGLPVLVDDSAQTVDGFCARARAEHSRSPLSLIVVDYLHLFEPDACDAKKREDQVIRRQAYALKTLAKALKVPVLALIQFNRDAAKSERPTMTGGLGGSAIEQASDNVVILVPDPAQRSAPRGRVTVFVDKRRGGSPAIEGRPVLFDRVRQRFTDLVDEYPRGTHADEWEGYTAHGGDAE